MRPARNGRLDEEYRSKVVANYTLLSVLHVAVGFLLLFFASYILMSIHGQVVDMTVPYYAGAYMSGFIMITISFVGIAIYEKGQYGSETKFLPQVRPLITAHFSLSLASVVLCIVGIILTAVYGLCLQDRCSYTTNPEFNHGMAALLICLELLCIVLASLSLAQYIHFHKYFNPKKIVRVNVIPSHVNRDIEL